MTVVHACVRDGRGGSPTAVLDDGPFDEDARRRIPRALGTSHAVFVSPRGGSGDRSGVPSLRFFTSEGELPSCGHGTIAALGYLAARAGGEAHRFSLRTAERAFTGWAVRQGACIRVGFEAGTVELREPTGDESALLLPALGIAPDGPASVPGGQGNALRRRTTVPHSAGAAGAAGAAGGFLPTDTRAGTPAGMPAGMRIASVGRPRLLVPVATPGELAALEPDMERLRTACDRLGLLGCYAYSVPTPSGRVAARMFAPSIGVPEDVANANSTSCLAAHLAGRGTDRISVDMGDGLGQPSTITAATRAGGAGVLVELGGAVLVAPARPLP
ncbi:PhzF family phenazine biosynthesis protein [Streptomyces sp. NPDC058872]|uniref:PhzF family phenazine biosynthesis protein n=1 Tax=Streptomyces sp. NPDC058872 TaxID=3346661 RepID=UPI0036B7C71F